MNMNNIGQYVSNYQYTDMNSAYKTQYKEKEKKTAGTWDNLKDTYDSTMKDGIVKAEKAEEKKEVQLSENAQELLKKLQQKYGNMDFFVANYSSMEEAQGYLNQGTKEFSVLLDPETLEKMANDEDTLKKYEDILSGMGDKFKILREGLGEDADKVINFGVAVDGNGEVSYFAELEKSSAKQRERIEEAREKKQEDKKAKEAEAEKKKAEERLKDTDSEMITASTMEELTEKIKVALEEIPEQEQPVYQSFDIRL